MKKRFRRLGILLFACLLPVAPGLSCRPATVGSETGEDRDGEHEQSAAHSEEATIRDELILSDEAVKAAGITTGTARLVDVPDYLETTGTVSVNQSRIAHMRPLSEGIVEEVLTQLGVSVREGQPLLRYDNVQLGELLAEHESTLSRIQQARASERVSRELVDRGKELLHAEAISERDFKAREAEYFQAAQGVASLEGELSIIQGKLHRYGLDDSELKELRKNGDVSEGASVITLQAPFDGTIIEFEVARGEIVDPTRSLMTIADLSSVWVMVDIYEQDLRFVRTGQTALVEVGSYPEEVFPGRITYIGDLLDPATRTVKARCVVQNQARQLKLGMFASVQLQLAGSRSMAAVPGAALQQIEGEDVVFIESAPGRFEKRAVQTGREVDGWVTVEDGLEGQEVIVTEGSFALKSELMREQLGGGHAH